jgi:hypothetical protein
MSQVFYLDIAYVAVAIHICCKCMFHTLFFRRMLQQMLFMLQVFSLAGAGSIVQVEAEVVPTDTAARVAVAGGHA